jgi:Arc/MetJ family transcription regulator
MTKKLTISVPDEVADRLAQEDNVSAFITSALRRVMAGEEVRRRHREVGYEVPERWVEAARDDRERLEATVAQIPTERRADLEAFSARLRARDREFIERMINQEND